VDPLAALASLACLALPLLTLGYAISCALFPFGSCRKCSGTGKKRSPFGRSFRLCRRCEGTGRRVRIGRRAYDYFRTEHERGAR
jgi:DnaJ-class molecular chaperone